MKIKEKGENILNLVSMGISNKIKERPSLMNIIYLSKTAVPRTKFTKQQQFKYHICVSSFKSLE